MSVIDDHLITITSPSAPGVERIVRVTEQPESIQLCFHMAYALHDAWVNSQPRATLFRNRRMAIPLGSDLMMPLDAAHGWWQAMVKMNERVPCHCCDTGNGRWGQIEIDWADIAYVGRACESCWIALGMDGDPDDEE